MTIITNHQPMLALTVRQPWAWAIAHGHKRCENRGWEPQALKVGDRFAIHAGAHQPELTDWQQMRGSVARSAGGDGRVPGLRVPELDASPEEFARGAGAPRAAGGGARRRRRARPPLQATGVCSRRTLASRLWELPGEVLFQVLEQLGESKRVAS